MTDAEFLAAFERCALPRSEWTHAAHVRLSPLHVRLAGNPKMMLEQFWQDRKVLAV